MSDPDQDDLVPVSVRLGEVVPPEDPEDWTKPLTWVAAAGMLLGPGIAIAWFVLAPPGEGVLIEGTRLLAAGLAAGAVLTGSTQQGRLRAWTATLAAGLFGALVIVIAGAAVAGERQVGVASPTLAHGFGSAVAGLVGAACASPLAVIAASSRSRWLRFAVPAAVAIAVAVVVLPLLFG